MIMLRWDNETQQGVIVVDEHNQIQTDGGLETAALMSLFDEAPAGDDDGIPAGEPRGGWWGDSYAEVPGDVQGSRVWLARRRPSTSATIAELEQWVAEGLQWMLDDGIASSVTPIVERTELEAVSISVEVVRPNNLVPHLFGPWAVYLEGAS